MTTNVFYGIAFITKQVGKRFLKINLYDNTFVYRYNDRFIFETKLSDKHTMLRIMKRYKIKESDLFTLKTCTTDVRFNK